MIIEVCVNSALSAVEAQRGGAARVELCENLHDGGATPSAGTIRLARKWLDIKLYVMIRPRGGDFLYSREEFEIMQEDIRVALEAGADGVVFGILRSDGTIDTDRMKVLIRLAGPMGITCHRAFDMTPDPFRAMEDLIRLGVERILTSGQQPTAEQGIPLISKLIARAGGRIAIMPGSGVKEHNFKKIAQETGATELHIHLDRQVPSPMVFRQPSVYMGIPGQSEFEHTATDPNRVASVTGLKDLIQ